MLPLVSIQKTDGNLGVATDTDRVLAIIGTASSGDFDVAKAFSNKNDVTAEWTSGPLVEAFAYMLDQGIPCVGIRGNPTTAGAYGTIDHSGVTGTATIAAGSTVPVDDNDVIVKILTGGALGTAGITFEYSMDDGVNWSQPQDLGTSLTLTCDGGVSFALTIATSTLVAGDTWSVTTTAPKLTSSDITNAQTALTDYSGEWLRALVLADGDATIFAQLDVFAKSFHADGKYPEMIGNTRARGVSEDRATFQAALATIAAAVQSSEVSACADACEMVSSVTGRRLRRPVSIPYAARLMLIDDSQDAAAKADGALPGIFVETADGVRRYHDERRYPGLDALGFTTLRTWGGRPVSPGVYITNPRVLAGPSSDYRYFQLSAIVNRAIERGFRLLEPKLSMSVLLGENGRIRPDVAGAIEESVNADLRTEFATPGRVSGVLLKLSRTDDLTTSDTITFDVKVQPLGVVKKFVGKTGLVKTLPST